MTDYIFDLDGTIYSGSHTFPSIVQLAKSLSPERTWFLSNSDRFSGDQIYQRLMQIGIDVIHPSHILTAQDIAYYWIAKQKVNCRIWAPGAFHLVMKSNREIAYGVGETRQDYDRVLLCLRGVEALVTKYGEKDVADLLRGRSSEIVAINLDEWVSRNGVKKSA